VVPSSPFGLEPAQVSGRRLASPDMATSDAAPGAIGPLEELVSVATPAPEIPEDVDPGTASAACPVLDDVEVVDAPHSQWATTAGTRGRLGGLRHHYSPFSSRGLIGLVLI